MGDDGPARTTAGVLGAVLSGLMVCVLAVAITISFTAFVFTGPLAGFLGQGIGLGLFGGLALGVIAALTTSYRGTIAQPQDVTAVILGLSGAAIAARLGTGDPERLYATIVMLIATASVVTGAVFMLSGTIRLGFVARYIPYPVLGGFLAATGYLITLGALGMAAGTATIGELATAEAAWRWVPAVLIGLGILVAARKSGSGLVIPILLLVVLAGFYGWVALSGIGLDEAGRRGLLLGPFAEVGSSFATSFHPRMLARADFSAILSEAPALLTLAGLALVGAILNASGIELASGRAVDADRDLRGIGLANTVAGAAGGLPGYHILSETLLARRMMGAESRWIGAAVGIACGLVLIGGTGVLAELPDLLFASVLVYLGLDLLYEWLWVERRRMPLHDFAIVGLILATAATIGFLQAVAVGVVAATLLFVLAYSRLEVVRTTTTAALRQSTTERPEVGAARLADRGAETLVCELQGYLFFGTAHALYERLAATVGRANPAVRRVILDFRRVQGLDVSALHSFGKLEKLAAARGVELVVAGLGPGVRAAMARAGILERLRDFLTLDTALAAVEEEILGAEGRAPDPAPTLVDRLLARAEAAGASGLAAESVAAGTELMRQGDPADELVLLEEGLLSARLTGDDGSTMSVATFLPGTVVGEIALYAGGLRTATVVAETDSRIRRISRDDLAAIAARDPLLAAEVHAAIAAVLARRLARTTALLHEMSR